MYSKANQLTGLNMETSEELQVEIFLKDPISALLKYGYMDLTLQFIRLKWHSIFKTL